jgi:immune inhibitor A
MMKRVTWLSFFVLFFSFIGIAYAMPPIDKEYSGGPANILRKEIDRPNPKDHAKMRQRQQLMERFYRQLREGIVDTRLQLDIRTLDVTGSDRVLVILVQFGGPDMFTWTPGISTWDPYGQADTAEYTGNAADLGTPAACNNIITKFGITGPTGFVYNGPLHNQIQRPLSAADASGDMIWTEDFNPAFYNGVIFGNGIVFSYARQDSSVVYEDFTGKSVNLFYNDMSGGIYSITGDIVGWVTAPHSAWWYGADPCPGARSGASVSHNGGIPGAGTAHSLVIDALEAVKTANPSFNWAQYDQDSDGVIDRLWIIHAGLGEEEGSVLLNRTAYGEGGLWSHSSGLSPHYEVVPGIFAGPYIMMPENAGIGVLAHEYGHNLGADDLYAYGFGETSAGFWTIMADDWTGYPIAFQPPAFDPWHLDNWGWLDPFVVTDKTQAYVVRLGQASAFPGGEDVYRGAKIVLPDGVISLPVQPLGAYQWWGGKTDLTNSMMTLAAPVSIPAEGATVTFQTSFDIESGWDFLWVQASQDGGTTWDTLTNTHTVCTHDPGWIGGLNGFPDDLCAAGIGGFTGVSGSFPSYGTETFSLNQYSNNNILLRFWYMTDWNTLGAGPFIDNVQITSGSILFSDGAESGDSNWNYAGSWSRKNGTTTFTHNYYLQWRNASATGGYDSALGDSRWRFGPTNTGLLVWYNNNLYSDNEIFDYLFDNPGFGPKGRMLVIEAHTEPYRDPYYVSMGYDNEGGNVNSRSLMRDAPFSLNATLDFTMTPPFVFTETFFPGLPAVRVFSDSLGYYPGSEFVLRGPGYIPPSYKWVTQQWDASAVVPSYAFYGIRAPGYTADEEFRFNCSRSAGGYLSCYYLGLNTGLGYDGGTGNPSDAAGQYGWNARILDQSDTAAKLMIWNSGCVDNLPFIDIPTGFWAEDYIKSIYCGQVTTGYADGTYRPSQNVQRSQMAAFIIRATFGEDFSYSLTPHFTDVLSGHWAFKYVQKMYDEGITTGYPDGTYRPSLNVTRGQMAAFIIKALFGDSFSYSLTPHFTDVTDSHSLFKYIQKMYDEGITTGYADGTYRPSQNVSRAQMATFIGRAFLGMK